MLGIENQYLGLNAAITEAIRVSGQPVARELQQHRLNLSTYLWELPIGTKGYVVGYDQTLKGYQGKLLSMGLSVGTEFTVRRHAMPQTVVEIDVKGITLRLTKPEANALCIESSEAAHSR